MIIVRFTHYSSFKHIKWYSFTHAFIDSCHTIVFLVDVAILWIPSTQGICAIQEAVLYRCVKFICSVKFFFLHVKSNSIAILLLFDQTIVFPLVIYASSSCLLALNFVFYLLFHNVQLINSYSLFLCFQKIKKNHHSCKCVFLIYLNSVNIFIYSLYAKIN